jgi:hypothetical protein
MLRESYKIIVRSKNNVRWINPIEIKLNKVIRRNQNA